VIFKYLGVVLDDTLSFNDHVDYVRMKVSKILRKFSRIRPSLTPEAANRLYKAKRAFIYKGANIFNNS